MAGVIFFAAPMLASMRYLDAPRPRRTPRADAPDTDNTRTRAHISTHKQSYMLPAAHPRFRKELPLEEAAHLSPYR